MAQKSDVPVEHGAPSQYRQLLIASKGPTQYAKLHVKSIYVLAESIHVPFQSKRYRLMMSRLEAS